MLVTDALSPTLRTFSYLTTAILRASDSILETYIHICIYNRNHCDNTLRPLPPLHLLHCVLNRIAALPWLPHVVVVYAEVAVANVVVVCMCNHFPRHGVDTMWKKEICETYWL